MNYKFLVIYQKSSGELIYRTRTSRPNYKVGDRTSMGWKVIDIKNLYKGNIITSYTYRKQLARKNCINDVILKLSNLGSKQVLNTITNYMMVYMFIKICVNFK